MKKTYRMMCKIIRGKDVGLIFAFNSNFEFPIGHIHTDKDGSWEVLSLIKINDDVLKDYNEFESPSANS